MGQLLLRGMIAGLLASLLAFGFARIVGEPPIERAIALEESSASAEAPHTHDDAAGAHTHSHNDEDALVSRDVQAGLGLFVSVAVYGTALGGLFALVFAFADGRLFSLSPRAMALVLAAMGFAVMYLVPGLKYPANPPAVGHADSIDQRTLLFFTMLVFSLAALAVAITIGRRLATFSGPWNGAISGGGIYLLLIVLSSVALPSIDEVPNAFPAELLWDFRIAALGTQGVLWASIGLLFGALVEGTRRKAI
ncbi:hypothetical protein DLM45_04410 [Hyphomicrobium methylovorum]|uniref:CbtA family protein n=1 Tax=Hyphomicrobium methylovorum TaxID=84 RepID=UPI0015E743B6|nr:CbtA family protein [Hyphomicrobium methylovorum]MBA2125467.1 hypothetical protein [Hyphomicrobium methylovorum]